MPEYNDLKLKATCRCWKCGGSGRDSDHEGIWACPVCYGDCRTQVQLSVEELAGLLAAVKPSKPLSIAQQAAVGLHVGD